MFASIPLAPKVHGGDKKGLPDVQWENNELGGTHCFSNRCEAKPALSQREMLLRPSKECLLPTQP